MAEAGLADSGAFEELLDYIREHRGFDFTGYKRQSLTRRFAKRMQALRLERYEDYRRHLEAHEDELTELFNTILINVTGFFRDPAAWEYLQAEIVPQIVESKRRNDSIRVWCTGCASGEEAYTLAIVLAEVVGEDGFRERVKIYATDLDQEALAEGRHGSYPAKALDTVAPELVERYFERLETRCVFRPDLRRSVVFGRHDLVHDPPISKIDLLASRNTLLYFTTEAQKRILANFHFALVPNGYLFLGKSETLLNRSNNFAAIDARRRVFRKIGDGHPRARAAQPDAARSTEPEAATGQANGLREAVFELSPLAQIVVDRDGALVLANQQARMLFKLSPRELGRPFRNFELSHDPVDLRSLVSEVFEERHPIGRRNVALRTPRGEQRTLDVNAAPLLQDGDIAGVNVSFADVTRYHALQGEFETSRREVETAYEELQSTVEELETTNEELQSTNEELETTNEELQSTNEELETMNEELQSTNEELETINEELSQRTEEFNATNTFLENILSSIEGGVIVVDRRLRVTAWNRGAQDLWGLRRDEVDGENLMDLDIGLPVDQLTGPLRQAMSNGGRSSEVVVEALNRRGKPFRCKVVCTPLQDGNIMQGAIVFMEDAGAP